jgi:hypothetical protein
MAKRKTKKLKTISREMFLVSWRDMQKDSDVPLPMRPFSSYQEAECYAIGCTDVLVTASKTLTADDWDEVRKDFVITQD